jgi:hypothetical protein
MRRQNVQSSNISSIGYDTDDRILEVEFHNGGIYQYVSVPSEVHRSFLQASSHGPTSSTPTFAAATTGLGSTDYQTNLLAITRHRGARLEVDRPQF